MAKEKNFGKKAEEKQDGEKVTLSREQLLGVYERERGRMNFAEQNLQTISRILAEIRASKEAAKEISETKKEGKMLIPLGAGIYAEAIFDGSQKLKKSLAGNVVVETTAEEAVKTLEKDLQAMEAERKKAEEEFRKSMDSVNFYGKIIQTAERKQAEIRGRKAQEQK